MVWRLRRRAGAVVVTVAIACAPIPLPVVQAGSLNQTGPTERYVVELDPRAVSPWLMRVGGAFGEALRTQAVRARVVDGSQAEVLFDYGALPFVAVATDDPAALAAQDGVVAVRADVPVHLMLDTSLGVINATSAQLETALSGGRADGSGRSVVIIDDGIQWDHAFFRNDAGASRVTFEACFNRTTCSVDTGLHGRGMAAHDPGRWHGTHVAGIAAGTQARVSFRTLRGVARNSDIVAVKVFDADGSGSLLDVDRGLTYVRDLIDAGLTTVSAVNMSLGSDVFFTGTCDTFRPQTTALIEQLRTRGVVTVIAAGNSSKRTEASWPACISGALPVGASTTTDGVASFSNVSQRVADAGLMAPGESICSSVPTTVASSGFACAGGTSMAAPHVAGAIVLLRQATTSASTASLIAAARLTPTVIADSRATGTVVGLERLDVSRALASTQADTGTLTGVLRDATDPGLAPTLGSTAITLSLVSSPTGSALSTAVTTDPAGRYTLNGVPVGAWNVTVSVLGYPSSAPQAFTLTMGSEPRATVDVTVSVQTGAIAVTASALPSNPAPVVASLAPAVGTPWGAREVNTTTASDGSFTIVGVRPGEWDLTLVSGSFAGATQRVAVSSGGTASAAVAMTALTGALSLSVADDEAALALVNTRVNVEASPVGAPLDRGPVVTSVTTSAQGTAVVPALRIGSWQVTVSAAQHDAVSTALTIVANTTTSASATLPVQRGSVTATIAYPAAPAPAAAPGVLVPLSDALEGVLTTLAFVAVAPTPWAAFSVVDTVTPGGDTFNVPGVRPGTWSITATATGYRLDGGSRTVSVVSAETAMTEPLVMAAVPHIASSTPTSGLTTGGTVVSLTGLHLDGATSVTFGGAAATSISTGTGTTLSAVAPARGSAGTVTVVVTTPRGTASTSYTYVAPAPVPAPAPAPAPAPSTGGGGAVGGGGGSASDPAPVTARVAASTRPGAPVTVDVELEEGVLELAFAGVAGTGAVTVQPRNGEPSSGTTGLRLVGRYVEVTASDVTFTQAELCVPYTDDDVEALEVDASQMRLLHFAGATGRRDITTRVDTAGRLVCGVTDRFSPFAIGVPATERVAGADRYATAVALSTTFYPEGAPTVYLASGAGFADALAAGAAAAVARGPVLLTAPGSLPSSVRAELVRLAPAQVIVVGGTNAVTAGVETAVRAALPRATVVRRQGSDRYATAVEVSRQAFPTGASTVYVATGLGFPDALAGASAAGRDAAPVLLVPADGVPAPVAGELARLAPQRVVLLGGTAALSSAVAAAVAGAVPSAQVTRIQGADRYATAASVAATFTTGSPVFAATGRTFPDALAGAAIAGRQRGPVIVVPDGTLPSSISRALVRLRPGRLVVLGGPGALSSDVELQLAAYLP